MAASGSGVGAARTIKRGQSSGDSVTTTAKTSNRNTTRFCTYYFKGNKECLLRCIEENGWEEETAESAVDRSLFIWFGNHVNQYSSCGVIEHCLTSRHQRSSRIDGMRVVAYKDTTQVLLERARDLFPDEYQFWPRGWRLLADQDESELKVGE
eukprot:CAMPEP_0172618452 /NCGR_PEP_ID=MMETSP1068-20121228/81220_1 /TAXON_ID=35684 /ORGANISM="Pseudopedinella elastica, Strain CCMP716" /LENGTH=152 /DNA_ID=CAMNT_0013424701 /DNA_START=1 /DNA_END=456 /DNA_ORIENTATION=+